MLFLHSPKHVLLQQPIKKDGLLRQAITCYEIAKRTYDFVVTYVENHTINMTLAMLLLVGNNKGYFDFFAGLFCGEVRF